MSRPHRLDLRNARLDPCLSGCLSCPCLFPPMNQTKSVGAQFNPLVLGRGAHLIVWSSQRWRVVLGALALEVVVGCAQRVDRGLCGCRRHRPRRGAEQGGHGGGGREGTTGRQMRRQRSSPQQRTHHSLRGVASCVSVRCEHDERRQRWYGAAPSRCDEESSWWQGEGAGSFGVCCACYPLALRCPVGVPRRPAGR